MKTALYISCIGAALLALATPSLAQEESGSLARRAPIIEGLRDATKEPPPTVQAFVSGQKRGQLLATDLIGLKVHDEDGTAVGAIEDVFLGEDEKSSVVVVNVGPYLGAEKRVAFALDSLGYEPTENDIRLVASIDRKTLESAPAFTSLADEMQLNDTQSLTTREVDPAQGPQPIPSQ